jgi:anti-sigma factor RsiW
MISHPPIGHLQMYFDKCLDPVETQELEQHLQSCTSCGTLLRELQSIRSTVKQSADVELSYGFSFRLHRTIEQEGSHEEVWGDVETVARNAVAAIAVLVLCMVVFSKADSVGQEVPNESIIAVGQLDSLSNHMFNKQGEISRDDLVYAVLSR